MASRSSAANRIICVRFSRMPCSHEDQSFVGSDASRQNERCSPPLYFGRSTFGRSIAGRGPGPLNALAARRFLPEEGGGESTESETAGKCT